MLCLVKYDEGRFLVLCLQVGGGRKIFDVQVRVCYYWKRLLKSSQSQVVLADAVFQSSVETMFFWY